MRKISQNLNAFSLFELVIVLAIISAMVAGIRAVVEHSFAWMKNAGYGRTRYQGMRRNALDFGLHVIAYNWKRSFSLARAADARDERVKRPAKGTKRRIGKLMNRKNRMILKREVIQRPQRRV